MYRIKLNDGSEVSELKLVGNVFQSEHELTFGMFAGKLSPCEITGKSEEGEDEDGERMYCGAHDILKLCYVRKRNGKWEVGLSEYEAHELAMLKLRGDVDFVAIMSGIEL